MASIKLVLRIQKINKTGEAPLYLRVTQNRKSHFVSLGIYINPKDWNEEQQKVKKSHPNSARLNNFLIQKLADTQSSVLDADIKSENVSTRKVKKAINGITGESFLKYFENYIQSLEERKKYGTKSIAMVAYNKLKKYIGDKNDILFEQITVVWLKNYEKHQAVVEGLKPNTIRNNLKYIKKLFNDALREDIITADKNPFFKYSIPSENSKREFLTEEEIKLIEEVELETPTQNKVRDLYLFALYAGGLRISDCVKLKFKDIKDDKIYIQQQKTSQTVSIKLTQKVKDIISRYKTEDKQEEDYIFPFFKQKDDELLDEKEYYKKSISFGSTANPILSQIAKKVGITKHIHFHTSRHTFATIALKRGMRIEYVSKLLGHSNISTTQIYAKIINEELDKAMMETFG